MWLCQFYRHYYEKNDLGQIWPKTTTLCARKCDYRRRIESNLLQHLFTIKTAKNLSKRIFDVNSFGIKAKRFDLILKMRFTRPVKRLDQWFPTWGLHPTRGAWQKVGGAWRFKTLWTNFDGCTKLMHLFTIKLIGVVYVLSWFTCVLLYLPSFSHSVYFTG